MQFKIFKNKEKTQENAILKSQKRQEKSRGRSMVEMLGVLAIIGVLSIGGIQGYTMAMRKYRANEILAVMQKYAMAIYATCQNELLEQEETVVEVSMVRDVRKKALNCAAPSNFLNAGLGGYPSGVKSVYFLDTGYIENNCGRFTDDEWRNCNRRHDRSTFLSTNSGDIVRFYVNVESRELCETIININGTVPAYEKQEWEKEYLGLCRNGEYGGNGYDALLSFIMN